MASVRGILNIQSLNELTYEKQLRADRMAMHRDRMRDRESFRSAIALAATPECTAWGI